MIDSLARGHTKDIYGPVLLEQNARNLVPAHLFRFADSIHALRAGRLPDAIPGRGLANASIHAHLNRALQDPKAWSNFLKSEDAVSLRKGLGTIQIQPGAALSGDLNEIAISLGKSGLRTPFLGQVTEEEFQKSGDQTPLRITTTVPSRFTAQEITQEWKEEHSFVLGRPVSTWSSPGESLAKMECLPFFIRAHFVLLPESVLLARVQRAPELMGHLAVPKTASLAALRAGEAFDFPILECISSNDPFEAVLSTGELMAKARMDSRSLQELMLLASWTAAFIRSEWKRKSVDLVSVNLRFGVDHTSGEWSLVDSLSLDDQRIHFAGAVLSHEWVLEPLAKTSWFDAMVHAKKQAWAHGVRDFRRLCVEPAPRLSPEWIKEGSKRSAAAAELLTEKVQTLRNETYVSTS